MPASRLKKRTMAGALIGFFADIYKGSNQPIITIVEPDKADCNYRTAKANEGTLHTVTESMNTIMYNRVEYFKRLCR